jgi:hypothetical protein
MSYHSDLDIRIKETPELSYVKATPKRLPILFEHITDAMARNGVAPRQNHTRVTPGTDECCLWPGCWVKADWLRACTELTYIPDWDTRVRFISEEVREA